MKLYFSGRKKNGRGRSSYGDVEDKEGEEEDCIEFIFNDCDLPLDYDEINEEFVELIIDNKGWRWVLRI